MYSIKKGYIFYERLKDSSPKWSKYYDLGQAEFNNIGIQNWSIESSNIISHLFKVAQQEQRKEAQLLNQVLEIDVAELGLTMDYTNFVKTFNLILNLKQTLLSLINRIDSKGNNQDAQELQKITNQWQIEMQKFITSSQEIPTLITNNSIGRLKQVLEAQGLLIFNQLLSKETNKGTLAPDWIQLKEVLDSLEQYSIIIKSQVLSRLGLTAQIDKIYTQLISTSNQANNKANIKSNLKQKNTIDAAISELFKEQVQVTLSDKRNATVQDILKSKNHTVQLFEDTMQLDLSQISAQYNSNSNKEYDNFLIRLRQYYHNYLSKLDSSLLVFENKSTVTINENFRGIKRSGKIEELPLALNQIGVHLNSTDLVYKLYNTMSGAIGEGQQEEIREDLRLAMSGCIANLLFPDWQSIGGSNSRAIHLFYINGKYIPLSYFLTNLAEAIRDYESSKPITVAFFLPEILYPEPVEENVYARWEKQRQAAKQSRYQITFLKNFKSLMASI